MFRDALSRHADVMTIEKDAARSVDEMRKLAPRKIFVFANVAFRTALALATKRPASLTFLPSQRSSAIYLDSVLTALARLFGVPTFLYLHGIEWRLASEEQGLKPRLLRYVFRNARGVVCLARSLADDLPECFSGSVSYLPNTIDTTRVNPDFSRALGDPIRLLFLSNIRKKKGIFDALHIAHTCRERGLNVRLIVAGSFVSNGVRREVEETIDELSIGNLVEIVGQVSGSKKWNVIESADLFLLPSYEEAFPIVLLEALAAATPCFGYDVGAIRELLEPAKGCEVANVGTWESAVAWIASHAETSNRYGEARTHARRRAEDFSLESFEDRVASLVPLLERRVNDDAP
jgi:glycosyltransferase involved in cell wall biosynthesis